MRGLLASPLGYLIGLSLGALGGGGSILAIPVLVYAAGQDPRAATATSLLLVGSAAVAGLGVHWPAGRVRAGVGASFGLSGIGGSLAGTLLNRHLDPNLLLLAFSALVLVAARRMSVGADRPAGESSSAAPAAARTSASVAVAAATPRTTWARPAVRILLVGSGVGFLTGLFGVGGGFVIVPALVLVVGLPMPEAVGTSLLVIAINSGVALAARLATAPIEWGVTIPFAIAAIAGVAHGGALAGRLDPRRSQRWFARLLVTVAGYTAVRAFSALR